MEKGPPEQREFVRWLKTASFDPLFPEYYPYYRELMTDSEGNILIFKFRLPWDKESPNIFQVYSPEGEFVCETSIVNNKYKLEIDQRFRRIS